MRKDHAAILFVLDETGSMAGTELEVESSWAKFLAVQRAQPGTAELWLLRFDSSRRLQPVHYDTLDAAPLVLHFSPGAMTPLHDAVGTMIDHAGRAFSERAEEDRPAKVVCVILTDGQENASGEYTPARIKEMVKRQREEWGWEFEFLGVGIDAWVAGAALNLPKDRYVSGQSVRSAISYSTDQVSAYRSSR